MADLKGGSKAGGSEIITQETHSKILPVVISGQIGSHTSPGIGLVPFDDFWVNTGGISYDSTTNRFTVSDDGVYRITMNCFMASSVSTRVLVGINNDAPTASNHRGHVYGSNASAYEAGSIDSVVILNAGDYIVFYILQGALYNAPTDRFNQFTIQKL